jgi:hypothetical protein
MCAIHFALAWRYESHHVHCGHIHTFRQAARVGNDRLVCLAEGFHLVFAPRCGHFAADMQRGEVWQVLLDVGGVDELHSSDLSLMGSVNAR